MPDNVEKSLDYLVMAALSQKDQPVPPINENRCRFDMFVKLKPGVVSRFKDQQRTWCFRGDRFTDIEAKMLRNLLNHLNKQIGDYEQVELYDNSLVGDNRKIVKIDNDIIVRNQLAQYPNYLMNYTVPQWLKGTQ